jgi:hypothetical protein
MTAARDGAPRLSKGDQALIGVNNQLFFREELERAVTFHIDRVPKITVSGWKNGNDDPLFMVVGCLLNPLAYCKFGHRELLSESSGAIIRPNWLTDLKQTARGTGADASDSAPCFPAGTERRPGGRAKRSRGRAQCFRDGLQELAALSCLTFVNDLPV